MAEEYYNVIEFSYYKHYETHSRESIDKFISCLPNTHGKQNKFTTFWSMSKKADDTILSRYKQPAIIMRAKTEKKTLDIEDDEADVHAVIRKKLIHGATFVDIVSMILYIIGTSVSMKWYNVKQLLYNMLIDLQHTNVEILPILDVMKFQGVTNNIVVENNNIIFLMKWGKTPGFTPKKLFSLLFDMCRALTGIQDISRIENNRRTVGILNNYREKLQNLHAEIQTKKHFMKTPTNPHGVSTKPASSSITPKSTWIPVDYAKKQKISYAKDLKKAPKFKNCFLSSVVGFLEGHMKREEFEKNAENKEVQGLGVYRIEVNIGFDTNKKMTCNVLLDTSQKTYDMERIQCWARGEHVVTYYNYNILSIVRPNDTTDRFENINDHVTYHFEAEKSQKILTFGKLNNDKKFAIHHNGDNVTIDYSYGTDIILKNVKANREDVVRSKNYLTANPGKTLRVIDIPQHGPYKAEKLWIIETSYAFFDMNKMNKLVCQELKEGAVSHTLRFLSPMSFVRQKMLNNRVDIEELYKKYSA